MDDSGWNWTVTAYVLLSAEIKCRYPSIFDAFSSVWLSNHLSVLFILPYHFLIKETCREVSIDHIKIKGCEQIVRLMFVVLVASISSCRDGFGFVLEVCLFTNLHSKIAGWLSSKEVVGCGHSVQVRGILSDSEEGYFNRGVFFEVYTIITSPYQGSSPQFACSSPILSLLTIMFSKRVCYDFFNRCHKCRKREWFESSG